MNQRPQLQPWPRPEASQAVKIGLDQMMIIGPSLRGKPSQQQNRRSVRLLALKEPVPVESHGYEPSPLTVVFFLFI